MFRARSNSQAAKNARPPEKQIDPNDPSFTDMAKGTSAVVTSACLVEVPKPLLDAASLKEIVLDYNRLVHAPLELFSLPNLKKLSLQHNYISALPAKCCVVSGKKLSTVALEGNPIAFPPPVIAFKSWSAIKKWIPENPSFVVYRMYHSEKDGQVSYVDIQYSCVRDTMVKTKDEDRDASFVMLEGETEATRLLTGNRQHYDKDKHKPCHGFTYTPPEDPTKFAHVRVISHAYFAVFDGHCGDWVSHVLTTNLYKKMSEAHVFSTTTKIDYEPVIRKTWLDLDTTICQRLRDNKQNDGSTAVTLTIKPVVGGGEGAEMILAHVGDSRVLGKTGKDFADLTSDHVPDDKSERERVEQRGGKVDYHKGCWRINQNLSVSRAFGDTNLKQGDTPIVDADPTVTVTPLTDAVQWLVICSDGLTHLMDTKDIGKITCSKNSSEEACLALFQDIAGNTRSQLLGHDNTTITVLKLNHGTVPVSARIRNN